MEQVARLTLDVGGVVIAVDMPARWLAFCESRYVAFLSNEIPAWHMALSYEAASQGEHTLYVEHEGPVTRFGHDAYGGWFDLAKQIAGVTVTSDAYVLLALERMLVYICLQALPQRHDGLLLHASGVVRRGQGHVFVGPSGAGKTTIARLAAGYGRVLCDENVIVRVGDDGPQVLSTPFWGSGTPREMVVSERWRVPLQALYALEQTPTFSLTRLSPGEAVLALMDSNRIAAEQPARAAVWLAATEQLLAQVPMYRLGFRPTAELWTYLDQDEPTREGA